MSLQPTTGAQPDTPKTCGDTRYPHKHPTLDLCYTPDGYKKYLEQNTGAGSAGAGTAGGGASIGACGTWCNIRDGAKQGTGCPSALTCADPPPPPPPQPWSPPPPLSPIWGPASDEPRGMATLAATNRTPLMTHPWGLSAPVNASCADCTSVVDLG